MEQSQTPKYATIFYHIREQLDITWVEYILLDMVYHLQAKTGYCYKSPRLMAVNLDITKQGANKMIRRMIDKGLMERLTDNTLRVTDAYINVQYISGNKVSGRRKGGNSDASGGNSVSTSGNSDVDLTDARITKNNNKNKAPASLKKGAGYKKYLDQRKQLGL